VKNFAKEFFKLEGGPDKKPLCITEFLSEAGNQLNPIDPATVATGAQVGTQAAAAAIAARPWIYAALKTNTLGGTGLICPWCSSTFRGLVATHYTAATKVNAAAALVGLDVALGVALVKEYQLVKKGGCY